MYSLEQAQKLVETENIEFFVLVQRLQNINFRLEQDTEFLQEEKVKKDAEIAVEIKQSKAMRDKQ